MRSSPPKCRSKLGPRSCMLIALHSMCQPGRPSPHGLGQNTAPSWGARAFQRAKSASESLVYSSLATRAPAHLVEIQVDRLPVATAAGLVFLDTEIDRAIRRLVGDAPFHQGLDELDHLRDVLGGARLMVGPQAAQRLQIREEG